MQFQSTQESHQDDYDRETLGDSQLPEQTQELEVKEDTRRVKASRKVWKPSKDPEHVTMERKIDTLMNGVVAMQDLMKQQQLLSPQHAQGKGKPVYETEPHINAVESGTTIYHNALEKADRQADAGHFGLPEKRNSSSSEDDPIDTSDELLELSLNQRLFLNSGNGPQRQDVIPNEERAETSTGHYELAEGTQPNPPVLRSEQMLREAEASKAKMLATKGRYHVNEFENRVHSTMVDDEYLMIGAHLDETLIKKIVNHEYVDFAKLLPQERLAHEEDHRMELISRNGMTYWAPVSDREVGVISSFAKWDIAFRVFSNVFTRQYPNKAAELIQYSHVIHTASLTYVWENVYLYDREFRLHISRHPQRSWSVILQQAWNLCLKDRLKFSNFQDKPKHKLKEACLRFNKGKCHSGMSCRYEHKCLNCGKFGHGEHICRRKSGQNRTEVEKTPQQETGDRRSQGNASHASQSTTVSRG